MAAKRGEAKQRILKCASDLVQEKGAEATSIESVAAAAGSAKGLVHYHFSTKKGLLSAVAEQLVATRAVKWQRAFEVGSAEEVVLSTWTLLAEESVDGTIRAWQSLVGAPQNLTDGLANELRIRFADVLRNALTSMLHDELGLTPTIEDVEIGMLLEALIAGIGFQLTSGIDKRQLEGVYSAAWLAILSMTQPSP